MEKAENSWNPKGGRPKKEEKEKRHSWINIRLTEEEKKEFEAQALQAGYKEVSSYARKKLLAQQEISIYNPKELFQALDKLSPQLKKVGVNINQVARYINYLDKNNIVSPTFIAEYNDHFKTFLLLKQEYIVAIRKYLKTFVK